MKKIITHIVYLAIIGLLLYVLGLAFSRPEKVVTEVKHTSDTVEVIVHDTVTVTKVVTEVITNVDTLYLYVNDTTYVPVPINEYEFSSDMLFRFRVKGYNVDFIDATIYPEIVYRTVTNTVEKEVVVRTWDLYLGGGIWAFNNGLTPSVALSIKAPKNLLFGANLGYGKEGLLVGGTIQYKITHNK